MALKWAVTERFHEYVYGGYFDVYTDNNQLTYVLITAKFATGQRWIANLANYNFKIYYLSGKSNVDTDALSRIPWEINHIPHVVLDPLVAKSTLIIIALCENIPHLPNAVIVMNELIIRTEFQLTKAQWREEQLKDYSISSIIKLLEVSQLHTYNCDNSDPEDLKSMMRMKKDFF